MHNHHDHSDMGYACPDTGGSPHKGSSPPGTQAAHTTMDYQSQGPRPLGKVVKGYVSLYSVTRWDNAC
jgi:hypothetical protein